MLPLARMESAAPDQSSLAAARKLLKRGQWPTLQCSEDRALLFGECQGSGATPYRMAVAVEDLGAKCSCPSRKFPCKHSLALMWWAAQSPQEFSTAEVPDWVTEWLGRRRPSASVARGPTVGPSAQSTERPTVAALGAEEGDEAVDPAAQERAERQRARTRAERERSVQDGLADLRRWLTDQLDRGLAAFPAHAVESCRTLARRLVDAKASGLASVVDRIPSRVLAEAGDLRHDVLLEELGVLHLVGEAFERRADLGAELRDEVEQRLGFHRSREALLADPDALRCRGTFQVIASRREVQPDKLVRLETWLAAEGESTVRHAVLRDFVPVAAAAGTAAPFPPGTRLDATLVFTAASPPLRAWVEDLRERSEGHAPPTSTRRLAEALAEHDERLARRPWLEAWPLDFHGAELRASSRGELWVVDDEGGEAIPLLRSTGDSAAPLIGLEDLSFHALFDGRRLDLLAVSTPLGPWWSSPA